MGSKASCIATGVGGMRLNTNGAGTKQRPEGAQRGDADGGGGGAGLVLHYSCAVLYTTCILRRGSISKWAREQKTPC